MFSNSQWIWNGRSNGVDEYVDFCLPVTVTAGNRYQLYLSCDTDYALYLGEALLAFDQYPDYPDYKIYDALELTDVLPVGNHELLLRVWYQGVDSQTYIKKPAGVIFTLSENGTPVLCSSEAIRSRLSPGYIPGYCQSISNQLGLSFSYDAERFGSEYGPSCTVSGLTRKLIPRPIQKLTLEERMPSAVVQSGGYLLRGGETASVQMQEAALVCRTAAGDLNGVNPVSFHSLPGESGIYVIADLGREATGFLDLDFTVPTACRVMIGWGEHLEDGRCRTAIRNFACEYHATAGTNRFLHPFRRLGGRYLQMFIEAPETEISCLTVRETLYPLDILPFECDNMLRRCIYDVCVNTLRQCMHEHYEDCPWREQALYTLDSRNQMLCGYHAFGETVFPKAALELISHGKRPDGLLTLCYPAGVDRPIPAFSLVYFIQMREYLEYTGDRAFLEEKYPFLLELLSVFTDRQNENGLVPAFNGPDHWNFYEWSPGMDGSGAGGCEAPLNAFLSLALQSMSRIAKTLDKAGDAARFEEMAARVNQSLVTVFFDEKSGLFRSFDNRRHEEYSVLTNSLCLLCGAAEGLSKETVLRILTANGAGKTGYTVIPNTLSMNTFRFDALLREDKERYRNSILDEIDTSYLAMLRKGATTFWETAVGAADFGGAGSLCHGWSALPVHYYRMLC